MAKKPLVLTAARIEKYVIYLKEQERRSATIEKYVRDLSALRDYLEERPVTKADLVDWKQHLCQTYAPSSVNAMLAAVNSFLSFAGRKELTVKQLKIQKTMFLDEKKELTRSEYARLVKTAEQQGNRRLSLVIQTICATGIRVSELQYITAEAVKIGRAELINKGKRRIVFLPEKLRRLLRRYLQAEKKSTGPVFTTRTGAPLNRSNVWREMKALCGSAGVDPQKVFPHNLRHLFARTFYSLEHDLSRLADILGHSNIHTTRIYTAESGTIHARQMERMGLIIT